MFSNKGALRNAAHKSSRGNEIHSTSPLSNKLMVTLPDLSVHFK